MNEARPADRPALGHDAFRGVSASFVEEEPLRQAQRHAADDGFATEVFLPIPDEELVRHFRPESVRDRVNAWTLAGGISGCITAFAMTIWMSSNWPLIVGGKPIVSWPPFICVAFELTVLYGSFGCVIGLCRRSHLPHLLLDARYSPAFLDDRFGLFVACPEAAVEAVTRQLRASGAEAAWPVYDLPRGRLE